MNLLTPATLNLPSHMMTISSCPTCEYSGRKADFHPGGAGDKYSCHVCGAKWRDINIKSHPQFTKQIASPPNCKPLIKVWPVVASLFALLLLGSGSYLFSNTSLLPARAGTNAALPRDNLEIIDVSIESYLNSNQPIWVVTGKVHNHTSHELVVPPLTIYSGGKGSSGYVSWTYRAALQKLAPGASFRFRTTIRKPSGSTSGIELGFGAT